MTRADNALKAPGTSTPRRASASLRNVLRVLISDDIEVDVFVHRHRLELLLVERGGEDRVLLLLRKAPREVGAELRFEQRDALLAAATVTDRVLDNDFGQAVAVLEVDGKRVRDAALLGIVVILRELRVLDADDLGAQRIEARIGGHAV